MQTEAHTQFFCLKTDVMFSLEDRRRETGKPKRQTVKSTEQTRETAEREVSKKKMSKLWKKQIRCL